MENLVWCFEMKKPDTDAILTDAIFDTRIKFYHQCGALCHYPFAIKVLVERMRNILVLHFKKFPSVTSNLDQPDLIENVNRTLQSSQFGKKNPQIHNLGWSKVRYKNGSLFYSGMNTGLVLIKLTKISIALRLRCGSCKLIFFYIISFFAKFKNVVYSLEPGETPSNSASHQAPNYVQHS